MSGTDEKESVKERLKAKLKQRNKPDNSAGEFEIVTSAMIEEEANSYKDIVKRKVLTIDLSNQSTYVQLGIGGATGWFTGVMVGKVGKAMAAAMGGGIMLINMGTRAGYITVDWEKVDEDMKTATEQINEKLAEQQQNEETQQIMKKGMKFVQKNLVMLGGFAAGFFMGLAT